MVEDTIGPLEKPSTYQDKNNFMPMTAFFQNAMRIAKTRTKPYVQTAIPMRHSIF
jgi:hypothetical protein